MQITLHIIYKYIHSYKKAEIPHCIRKTTLTKYRPTITNLICTWTNIYKLSS